MWTCACACVQTCMHACMCMCACEFMVMCMFLQEQLAHLSALQRGQSSIELNAEPVGTAGSLTSPPADTALPTVDQPSVSLPAAHAASTGSAKADAAVVVPSAKPLANSAASHEQKCGKSFAPGEFVRVDGLEKMASHNGLRAKVGSSSDLSQHVAMSPFMWPSRS